MLRRGEGPPRAFGFGHEGFLAAVVVLRPLYRQQISDIERHAELVLLSGL